MKEIFAGFILAAALAAVVTTTGSDGQGTDARIPDRRAVWNDLRGRDAAPRIHDARFVGPRNMPIQINSPAVLLDPAKRFADAAVGFAADVGADAGPALGPTWLVARAARLAEPRDLDRPAAPRAKGAARSAPLPVPRPDQSRPAQGVLSAALGLLEKAGLEAMTPAPPDDPALADKAGSDAAHPGPERVLPATHPDRAPGRPI